MPVQPKQSQQQDVIKALNLKAIKPINRQEIPRGRGRSFGFQLKNLSVVKEFNVLLGKIREQGISPYEIAAEIDTNNPEILREKQIRKSFGQSFRVLLKECIKNHGLDNKIDITETGNGARFFIVGREA